MINFAVVGYGMMGATHLSILKKNPRAHVAALVENDPTKLKSVTQGNIGETPQEDLLNGVPTFTSIEEMLAATEVDCVSICLPTHLHRRFVTQALEAGKHVICEKPMALSLEDCDAMIEAAGRNQKRLFIAQCIRFWPEYAKTKEIVDSGRYGRVKAATFQRLSMTPIWSWDNWLLNGPGSGGSLMDLHIHDSDFVQYLFGMPKAVCTHGIKGPSGQFDHVVTNYVYDDEKVVTAEGGWIMTPSFGFEMSLDRKSVV